MRILFATDAIREPATGVGRVSHTLLRELVAAGHEVVTLDWRRNPTAEAIAGRGVVLSPRLPWAKTALWHFELARRARPDFAADVLFDPSGYPCVLPGRHRLVTMVHDLHMLEPGCYRTGKRAWFRACLGQGLRHAAAVVCPSEHTRSALLARYPIPPERVAVVPDSLDPDFANVAEVAAEREKTPVGAGEEPYFLVVGTIEERKNALRIVAAFAAARAHGVAARLVFVGRPGFGYQRVVKFLSARNLWSAVEFRTAVGDAELRRLYRNALALVFPSRDEGFGLPILEAFASGTPVLTSSISATAEVAGSAALLVDPYSTTAITQALLRLWHEPHLRQQLIVQGAKRVKSFDSRTQAQRLVQVFAAVAGLPLASITDQPETAGPAPFDRGAAALPSHEPAGPRFSGLLKKEWVR